MIRNQYASTRRAKNRPCLIHLKWAAPLCDPQRTQEGRSHWERKKLLSNHCHRCHSLLSQNWLNCQGPFFGAWKAWFPLEFPVCSNPLPMRIPKMHNMKPHHNPESSADSVKHSEILRFPTYGCQQELKMSH